MIINVSNQHIERILVSNYPNSSSTPSDAAKHNIQLYHYRYRQELAFNIVIDNIIIVDMVNFK